MSPGVLLIAAGGKIISANPSAASILGTSIDEILTKQLKETGWRFINEDGSDFPNEDHPSLVALRTGERVQDVGHGIIAIASTWRL